jgi:hypothetical protein
MFTKKVVALCVIILTLFFAPLIVPNAFAQTFSVYVNPPTQTVGIGEQVTANVSIADISAPGLYSFQLDIHYDNTLLNATGAAIPTENFLKPTTPGNIFIIGPTVNQTLGVISFAATLLGNEAGKTGSGLLGTMTFTGLAVGNATLEIQNMILVDGDGLRIADSSFTSADGLIAVIPEFALIALMAIFAVMSAAAVKMKKKLK